MIKAVDAYKKSLGSKQIIAKQEFKDLVSLIESDIQREIIDGGADTVEVIVDNYNSKVVALVAEHIRTFGWKTALVVEKETTRTLTDKGTTYNAEQNEYVFLRISAAHLEGQVFLDDTLSKKKPNTKK